MTTIDLDRFAHTCRGVIALGVVLGLDPALAAAAIGGLSLALALRPPHR